MEFGPSDRYEVIELKGFDDNEIEKDGIGKCVFILISTAQTYPHH